jgi:protein KTI12
VQSKNPYGIMIDVPEASFPILIPVHVATTGMTDELASIGGVPVAMKLQNLRRKWISLNRRYLSNSHGKKQGGLAADQVGDAFVPF